MEFLNDTLTLAGSALEGGAFTVTELVRLAREHGLERTLSYTLVTGGGKEKIVRFTGADLAELLPLLGLAPDSPGDTPVTALFKDGLRLDFTLDGLRRAEKPVLVAWAAGGLPLIGPTGRDPLYRVFTEADGFSKAAGNSGGPLRLVAEGGGSNAPGCGKWLALLAAGEFDGALPPRETDETAPAPLPACPPLPAGRTPLLELRLYGRRETVTADELLALPRVEGSFAARDGRFAFAGAPLLDLLESRLHPGEALPEKLYARSGSGYAHALDPAWVRSGVESRYQPGQHRPVLLAWAMDGSLLSREDGPLRLVVENEIACWIKGLAEITDGL